jgi:hypothetical protein
MPDAFALANAFVRIRPDATGFRVELDSKVKAALAGLDPTVNIGASTKGAKAAAMELKAYLNALTDRATAFRLVADDKQLQAELAKIFVQLASLQGRTLAKKITLLGFARMQAELLAADSSLEKIAGRVSVAHVDVSGDAEKQLALLQVQLITLSAKAHDIKLGITDAAGLVAIAAIQKALQGVASHVATLTVGTDTTKISDAVAQVRDLSDQMVALTAKTNIAAGAARNFGGWLGFIGAKIPLFGGIGPAIITQIAAWHLLTDVVIDFIAVLLPATIALGAFIAAGIGTAQDIFKQMSNVNTVTTATNKALYPMTARLRSLADAVQPQVYQLFGEFLNVVNSRAGTFTQLAKAAGTVMDQLAARTAIAIESGGMQVFLHNATQDLAKLGDIVGNIFGTVGNLLKAMPGYAQVLLNIVDQTSKGLEAVTGSGFAQGVIKVGLAFHGAAVYLGVFSTAAAFLVRGGLTKAGDLLETVGARLLQMNGPLARAGPAFYGLAAGASDAAALPWGWIAVVGVGIGILAYKILTAKDATQQWFQSLQSVLLAQNAVKGFISLQQDQAIVATRLAATEHNLNMILNQAARINNTGGNLSAPVNKTSEAYLKAAQASRDYASEITTLNDQSALYNVRLDKLAIAFGGVGEAQGILLASGVKMSQLLDKSKSAWLGIMQQVQATQAAYKAMGQTGGILGADMNALNIAASDQVTAMQKVNQAFDTVIGIISGGQTSFLTFQQDMLSVGQSLSQAGGSARIVTNTFPATASAIAAAASHSKASMTGLNAASLQLRSTWQTAFSGGASLIDALRLMQSASPGGFPPVTRAVKDIIAQLVPLGKTSGATRAELVSMAQEIDPNIHNFTELTKWLGNTKNAGKDLNTLVAKMGINLQDLAKDASNLYATLQSDIIKQFDVAKLSASGASKAISTLATDLTTTGTSAHKIHSDEATLYKDFVKSGLSAKDATTLILSMSGGINLAGLTAKQKHTDMLNLYNDFRKAGLGAKAAADLVHGLTGELFKVPKHTDAWVDAHGSGTGNITFKQQAFGQNSKGYLSFHAAGALIQGHGNQDSVAAMLTPGEAVVPRHLVPSLAPFLAAHRVPGFASGGFVGPGSAIRHTVPFMGVSEQNWMQQEMDGGIKAAVAAARAALAKALRAGGHVNYNPSAGVAQWRGDVFRALSMLHLPAGDVLDVLYQMMTESGGNPNIVNRTDSNWLAGHPSVGLMQVIAGTFDTWAGPYRNTGPFSYGVSVNPMANIYAALNYGKHGLGFGTGPGQIGSGHGYDKGGWLMPGATLAVNNTGRPERVSAPGEPVVVKMIFASSGSADFDRFMMTWIKRSVSVSGGGNVQAAFGSGT